MYKILIVSATRKEVEPLLEAYNAKSNIHNDKVFSFVFKRCAVDVLITGVGMVATAFEMGFWLSRRTYDLLLNAGIAGSFRLDIPLGTAVQVVSDEIAEWGAEDANEFIDIAQLPFFDANAFPYQNAKLIQEGIIELPIALALKQVRGITVYKTSGNTRTIKSLKKKYKPYVETMESAAFFYATLSLRQTNFAAIRTISNYVELRNTDNWDLPLAIKNLNEVLNEIVVYYAK